MRRGMQAALSGVVALAALALCAGPGFAQSTNTSDSSANSGSSSTAGARSNQNQGQSVTYYQTTPADQTIKNVPNVYGPGLTAAGSEVCLGSISAGGAGAGFGLTVGGTIVDQECQLRMNARTLATLGYATAAREEMCLDPQVRSAMVAAGTPCMADQAAAAKPVATAEYDAPARRLPSRSKCLQSRRPRVAVVTRPTNCLAAGTTSARRARRRPRRRPATCRVKRSRRPRKTWRRPRRRGA